MSTVSFSYIIILYIVLVVIYLSGSVYRQAQATFPTLVVNKIINGVHFVYTV